MLDVNCVAAMMSQHFVLMVIFLYKILWNYWMSLNCFYLAQQKKFSNFF